MPPSDGWASTGRKDAITSGTTLATLIASPTDMVTKLTYCTERQSYYVWTGQQWQFDEFVEVEKRAEEAMLGAFADAKHIADSKERAAFLGFVNQSLSRKRLTSMIHLAKKKVRQSSTNDFDRDPWLLNVANGTVDLRKGVLRPHRADDLLSKGLTIRYDRNAECPIFMNFL